MTVKFCFSSNIFLSNSIEVKGWSYGRGILKISYLFQQTAVQLFCRNQMNHRRSPLPLWFVQTENHSLVVVPLLLAKFYLLLHGFDYFSQTEKTKRFYENKNTKTILTYMSLLLNITVTATKSQNGNLTSVKIQLLLSWLWHVLNQAIGSFVFLHCESWELCSLCHVIKECF